MASMLGREVGAGYRYVQSFGLLLCSIGLGCHVDSGATGQHSNRQQGNVSLTGSLARTRAGILESFASRRGTWQPDGQIMAGEWVTLLGEADADNYVLVKPRAELDIIRRMHLSLLEVEGRFYRIPVADQAKQDLHCPMYGIDEHGLTTHASKLAFMPGDMASDYRWVIGEQAGPIGFVSRYCSSQANSQNNPSLHAHGAMARKGDIVLSQESDCDAPVCYGFELESTSLRIVDYYRTPNVSEAEWLSMPRSQKEAALNSMMKDPSRYALGERLHGAPAFISHRLSKERDVIWEIRSIMPQPSLQHMLSQMGLVRDLFESRWSVHLHVSFPVADPVDLDMDQIRSLAYLINEYLALRVYAHDVPAVLHQFTGPATWEGTARVLLAIQRAHEDKVDEFKYHFVSLRCRDPYGNGRCGFEIRRSVTGLEEQIWLLERLKDFWNNPSAGLRLHNAVPLTIPSMPPATDHVLSTETWKAFQHRKPALAFGLEFAGSRLTTSSTTALYEIAMVPLVNWEARIEEWRDQGRLTDSEAADLTLRVTTARGRYLEGLNYAILPKDGKVDAARIRIEVALSLHQWAQQTELWKYY